MQLPAFDDSNSYSLFLVLFLCTKICGNRLKGEDYLIPYKYHHGPKHGHRHVRDCQPVKYGNVTHELHKAHDYKSRQLPVYEFYQFAETVGPFYNERIVIGRQYIVNNPAETLSVVEPGGVEGGCAAEKVVTVEDSSDSRQCLLAVNAGFFNITSYSCLGNVVSDSREAHNSGGIQNVHFGITHNGSLFFGYLPEDTDLSGSFRQLVGGVIWLLRDGEVYIDESKIAECSDTQTSGDLQYFIDVSSARTAIGSNKQGQVVVVQVDGETGHRGINMYEMADMLKAMGVVNAVNLDGGGSSTAVMNGQVTSAPSDSCRHDGSPVNYRCARKVSTILCVHDIPCQDDCHHHGNCIHGQCDCYDNWTGTRCEALQCGLSNCTDHGICTADGCVCQSGWFGESCEVSCPPGTYGRNCWGRCLCYNSALCDPADGSCHCLPGYTGLLCDRPCPYGWYGADCRQLCYCPYHCTCHHITGTCNITSPRGDLYQASYCLTRDTIAKQKLVPEQPEQYRMWLMTIIVVTVIAGVSLIMNISLICRGHVYINRINKRNSQSTKRNYLSPTKQRKYQLPELPSNRIVDSSSYSDECDKFSGTGSVEKIAMKKYTKTADSDSL